MQREHQSAFNAVIVFTILSYCDRQTNVNCARVSHLWADISLNNVWKDMAELSPLLRVLCPLSQSQDSGGYRTTKFSRELEARDFGRFEYYSRRVRSLTITPAENLDRSIFIELGCFRQQQRFFPNLSCLKLILWNSTQASISPEVGLSLPRFSTLFMHDGLQRLELSLPTGLEIDGEIHPTELIARNVVPLPRLFRDISIRSPNLTVIYIDWLYKRDINEGDLITFITGLAKLQRLYLPPCTVTPPILKALSTLKNIREIGSMGEYTVIDTITNSSDDVYRNYTLKRSHQFNALTSLHISGILANITPAFRKYSEAGPFPRLTSLHISVLQSFSAQDIGYFSATLSKACPCLESLKLKHDQAQGELYRGHPITIQEMNPFIEFRRLHTLVIESNARLSVTDDALATFLSQLPSVTTVRLVQEPFELHEPVLTLEILQKLAMQNSQIENLALYVDATTAHRVSDDGYRLQKLNILHFGDSPILDPEDVASYLHGYLPFKSTSDIRVRNDLPESEEREKRRTKWLEVDKLLKFASRIKRIEAEKSRVPRSIREPDDSKVLPLKC